MGDKHFVHFIEWCDKVHSNAVVVWRKLDRDQSMNLHKREFLLGLKALKYDGNADYIFNLLDRDKTGMVSFLEFVPEIALELARFRHWAVETFGSIDQMFIAMDNDGSGTVTFSEFAAGCHRRNLPAQLKDSLEAVFQVVDTDHTPGSAGTITAAEIHFLSTWKPPAYLFVEPDVVAAEHFKAILVERCYGNPGVSWRRHLDKDGNMRVSYEEFIIQCRALARDRIINIPRAGDG